MRIFTAGYLLMDRDFLGGQFVTHQAGVGARIETFVVKVAGKARRQADGEMVG
jgi:hypothetical protein